VARLDPARRPAAWPGDPAATVVLDVAARQRNALHAWIRHHHQGPLVVLLKPGDRRRRRRARRGRRLAAQVLVGLLVVLLVVLLVLAGVWLALGLADARRDLPLGPVAVAWPAAALDLRG
jgi:hypothetical protein